MKFTATTIAAIVAVTITSAAPTELNLKRDTPPAQCAYKDRAGTYSTSIGIYYPQRGGNVGDWGLGILDNVRGHGCNANEWQAIQDSANGIACTFNIAKDCSLNDIAAAIEAATGEWLDCDETTMDGIFDSNGNVISSVAGTLGAAAQALSNFA
ncbi:hypothetical protein KCU92_g9929, partial [Aureobasidium melanogenum]